ncbi:MAG: right-handed parallel beta-helix repeat-containing protein [Planctomycetaceae bacterium]
MHPLSRFSLPAVALSITAAALCHRFADGGSAGEARQPGSASASDGKPSTSGANVGEHRVGTIGPVGVKESPRMASRLRITEPGVYENILVDGGWSNERLVRITADDVVLRNCELRNGRRNAVEIYADDVLIENCRIHHVLRGTFDRQEDAHGITGRPRRLVVRNCEIHHVSGDALQFDPDRGGWGDVLIENCTLWTGPVEEDTAGFRRGERPGENAIDTKCDAANLRSRLVVRNCRMYGWGRGQIENQAAFNLKENLDASVENCVFHDNDICFRLRGDTGRGNADVAIRRCAIYDSKIGIRTENRLANLRIDGLGIGEGVVERIHVDRGKIGAGFVMHNTFDAPPLESVLKDGVSQKGP